MGGNAAMPIDTTPSTVATSALQAIPFGSLIGAPLDAAINAQVTAAKSTVEFINSVGFDAAGKAKSVVFEYQRDGKIVSIIVPVLAIVPIPYIQVDTITIDFLANISASASTVSENSESSSMGGELGVSAKVGWGPFSVSADFKANYSSKKDSKATAESRYSVEYTMSVHVGASQSNMPAGLAAVLNILQGSIAGSEPGGELTMSPRTNTIANRSQAAYFELTVKDGKGILVPNQEVKISLQPATGGLVLKALGISPGTPVGQTTATSATATTDGAGVVGVTVEIDPSTGDSIRNLLKMGASVTLKSAEGAAQAAKTANAQLTVLPQEGLPATLVASPTKTSGKASETKTITVALKDGLGKPLGGETINGSSSDDAVVELTSATATTDAATGVATFTATLIGAGTATLGFNYEDTNTPVTVSVAGTPPNSLSVDPDALTFTSTGVPQDITVTLLDGDDAPLAGKKIVAKSNDVAIATVAAATSGSDTTNSAGVATFKVTRVATTAKNSFVTVSFGGSSQMVNVTITA